MVLEEADKAKMAIAITSILSNNSHIPILNCENFSDWKDKILLTFGCMDIDLALHVDKLAVPMESSPATYQLAYERCEKSNRQCLMFIKSHVSQSIKVIEEQFVSPDKALTSTLINKLLVMKHHKSKSVREHIKEMKDIAAHLKSLEIKITESFFVHFILNSLSAAYGPFKISYNTHKEKWSINELLTICVQEEERLKHKNLESANFVTHRKGQGKKGKGANGKPLKKKEKGSLKRNDHRDACFFYKKKGHQKKDCLKYK
ncbi:uncharacterized protein LOC131166559 [Malania oleifera]|uniref:uncharacterized protein LOC131166559 n=1 Tax=Malania oleifera TaxID=397392 RepID=UPI0025AE9EC8|nr:uncharacterized protein LOC131166559 [Malania oleifera]